VPLINFIPEDDKAAASYSCASGSQLKQISLQLAGFGVIAEVPGEHPRIPVK
jgi:hypothetical protein